MNKILKMIICYIYGLSTITILCSTIIFPLAMAGAKGCIVTGIDNRVMMVLLIIVSIIICATQATVINWSSDVMGTPEEWAETDRKTKELEKELGRLRRKGF